MEPTSALTFEDLILEVSRELGLAYYGPNGDDPVSIPIDAHDLAEAKRHVNNAIRMFIHDAPPTGWRWMRPITSITVEPFDSEDEDAVKGNYDLPLGFSGDYEGTVTLAAGTNQGFPVRWANEALIRQLRENETVDEGWPQYVAIRVKPNRRHYEMLLWPSPHQETTLEFPAAVQFDSLVELTDTPPIPFSHDETIKSACLAVAERDGHNQMGQHWAYYREMALPNSYNVDGRSAPKRLGYFGNPERGMGGDLREFQKRLPVQFNN